MKDAWFEHYCAQLTHHFRSLWRSCRSCYVRSSLIYAANPPGTHHSRKAAPGVARHSYDLISVDGLIGWDPWSNTGVFLADISFGLRICRMPPVPLYMNLFSDPHYARAIQANNNCSTWSKQAQFNIGTKKQTSSSNSGKQAQFKLKQTSIAQPQDNTHSYISTLRRHKLNLSRWANK